MLAQVTLDSKYQLDSTSHIALLTMWLQCRSCFLHALGISTEASQHPVAPLQLPCLVLWVVPSCAFPNIIVACLSALVSVSCEAMCASHMHGRSASDGPLAKGRCPFSLNPPRCH